MEQIIKDIESSLRTLATGLKEELFNIRTNRPSAKLIENIKVDYMEQQLSIKQLGSISILPPREINVSCWDKDAAGPIAKAIEISGLGVSASADGSLVRITLPQLTDDRRRDLEKLVKSLTEQVKIRVRNSRDDSNKKIEAAFKAKMITEDQKFNGRKKIQNAVDKTNEEMESLLNAKIKEIGE